MNTPSDSTDRSAESNSTTPDGFEALQGMEQVTPLTVMRMFGKGGVGLHRALQENQACRVHVYDVASRTATVIAEFDDALFEAPNWSLDSTTLYVNGQGRLWAIPLDSPSRPHRIDFEDVPAFNNDHVLDPRGDAIFLSGLDGQIYRGQLNGSSICRITNDDEIWHFLHGVSPDGRTLGFVQIIGAGTPSKLALIPADGGAVTVVDTGNGAIDGPEWSPDGKWIYFNTERWASAPGHAQLARIPSNDPTAANVERLLSTDTVDWFPHLSPDGKHAVYLQYPPGTVGHPEDTKVELVLVDPTDWSARLDQIPVLGGQGTINVNSWSPDSAQFAFISYPYPEPQDV
jgi:TolB protein